MTQSSRDDDAGQIGPATAAERAAILPQTFSTRCESNPYLREPAVRKLVDFFEAKGLAALKDEDQREQWYADWITYQAEHRIYASVLSPRQYTTLGTDLDLLRLARFVELFAYFSPAHGYSFQVSFLGLFAILMGTNDALKQEAVAALEAGGLLAFGVSEKSHGSDLLANEFTLQQLAPDRYVAQGTKYYIGNANAASIIAILARKLEQPGRRADKRAPLALFALRPAQCPGFGNLRKVRTLGVRAGFVGAFDVNDHALPATDLIAEGRDAWDAMFGAVTLGKFLLGFASIGICEHALAEATSHLTARILFGKPAIQMPHLRFNMAQAYARLAAMKLYSYRALDYVHAASAEDRRYLLFAAVQKAKVSTEGVKVMALLSECMGARGFEAETYFETALRDAQLIPAVEGSTHINLGLAAQFLPRYFSRPSAELASPRSLVGGEEPSRENPYLMQARTGGIGTIAFRHFIEGYQPLRHLANVRTFTRQVKSVRLFTAAIRRKRAALAQTEVGLALGQCLATIAYGQLVAESAWRLEAPGQLVSVIFHLLVNDLSALALSLASSPHLNRLERLLLRRAVSVPTTSADDWQFVAERLTCDLL
jgi:acyl-CoA dehydrogenase